MRNTTVLVMQSRQRAPCRRTDWLAAPSRGRTAGEARPVLGFRSPLPSARMRGEAARRAGEGLVPLAVLRLPRPIAAFGGQAIAARAIARQIDEQAPATSIVGAFLH